MFRLSVVVLLLVGVASEECTDGCEGLEPLQQQLADAAAKLACDSTADCVGLGYCSPNTHKCTPYKAFGEFCNRVQLCEPPVECLWGHCGGPTCPLTADPTYGYFPEDGMDHHKMYNALSGPEMTAISEFMLSWDDSISAPADARTEANYITLMDAILPVKADALAFLDGEGPQPDRYARVVAIRGADAVASVKEYKVGPIPVSRQTTVTELSTGGFDQRTRDGPELSSLDVQVIKAMKTLDPMIRELLNCGYNGRGDNSECLHWHPGAPTFEMVDGKEIRRTIIWMQWRVKGGSRAKDVSPAGLVLSVFEPLNADGSVDSSTWYAKDFYYHDQGPYATAQDLLDAYNAGSLETEKVEKAYVDNLINKAWPFQPSDDPAPPGSEKLGPRQFSPAGSRFTVKGGSNGEGASIKWMDWEVFTACTQARGPVMYDIRYKGRRIAYEIALQEAFITYSGDDPVRANTFFFDAPYGQGELQPVVPGVDCPEEATLLSNAFYDGAYNGGSVHKEASFCVFEHSIGGSFFRRNYDAWRGGLPETELVIRYPMSPGNYDTILDFRLAVDGTFKTRLKLSGYMQTHAWSKTRDGDEGGDVFGYRVAEHVHGSLHDHHFGFKVDLDVLGEKNSFEHIEVKADTVENIYNNVLKKPVPAYAHLSHMKYLDAKIVENENEARYKLTGKPVRFNFINEDEKNGLGNHRGYSILHFDSEGGSIMPDEFIGMNGGAFSKYSLTVTKRKEEELAVTGNFDLFRINNPLVSLNNYVDGESIRGEDLVAWVTVSKTHIATAEHYPIIPEVGVSGFTLKPNNYFDSSQAVRFPSKIIDTSTLEVLQDTPQVEDRCVPSSLAEK